MWFGDYDLRVFKNQVQSSALSAPDSTQAHKLKVQFNRIARMVQKNKLQHQQTPSEGARPIGITPVTHG